MKLLKLFTILLLGGISYGQVGIGTTNPKGILHVSSTTSGIIIPRMTASQANAIVDKDLGELIFVTNTSPNFSSVGFYFWDGVGSWELVGGSAATGIYSGSGTVPSSVSVGLTNTLNFDNGTLFIDGTNNRVGFGNDSPFHKIDLGSNIASQKLAVYQNAAGNDFYGFGVAAGKLQIHAANSPTMDPDIVITSTGRVGIRESNPTHDLHIKGNVRFEGLAQTGSAADQQVVISDDGELKRLPSGSGPESTLTSFFSSFIINSQQLIPNSAQTNANAFTEMYFAHQAALSNNITLGTVAPNINRLIINSTGVYSLSVSLNTVPNVNGWSTLNPNEFYVDIRRNGTIISQGAVSFSQMAGQGVAPQVSAGPIVLQLNENDVISVFAWHRGSGGIQFPIKLHPSRCYFSVVQIK